MRSWAGSGGGTGDRVANSSVLADPAPAAAGGVELAARQHGWARRDGGGAAARAARVPNFELSEEHRREELPKYVLLLRVACA